MAVNRVVLQHMSLNLLEEGELYPSIENSFHINDDSNLLSSNDEKNEECLNKTLTTSQELLSGGQTRYVQCSSITFY